MSSLAASEWKADFALQLRDAAKNFPVDIDSIQQNEARIVAEHSPNDRGYCSSCLDEARDECPCSNCAWNRDVPYEFHGEYCRLDWHIVDWPCDTVLNFCKVTGMPIPNSPNPTR